MNHQAEQIPALSVHKYRKVLMQDLIEYRDKRAENRHANIEEMSKLSQELGLYD